MKHPYPLWHPTYWLATWFHSGLAPKAPGTFGTLAALPFAWVIREAYGEWNLFYASFVLFFIGWWVSAEYVKKIGREDPKEVVIDEVVGMWLVISACQTSNINILIIVFLLFRLFDIWKPWPISWVDRKVKGGLGIMLDDILAAAFAIVAFYVSTIILIGPALWA